MPTLLPTDIDFLKRLNNEKPIKAPRPKISEYIQGKRILPPNTPFPGPFDNARTPYAVEIMDCLSPVSDIQHVVIMKGAQLGLTAAAENVVAYWMDENPAEILYISGNENLLERWATKRLDPLIDSCDFRHKIFAQTENKKSRRHGDKLFIKEYMGGTLDMASAQSAPSLRSDSKRILIRDEVDSAPAMLKTGEGNWLKVSAARADAWGARKKIMDISTPTTAVTSLILPAYEMGDCRHFFVPCPKCNFFQVLQFDPDDIDKPHGLKAVFDNDGLVDKVYYICEKCGFKIYNHHKTAMLNGGEWRPTKKANYKNYRSYWISSLYSPVGMLSWEEFFNDYLSAREEGADGMRSFTNLKLGMVYREAGARPKLQNVIELRGSYRAGTVPFGPLFLTMGIDVQAGSAADPNNPPRLELEIMGSGSGFRTWSILYKRIEGAVENHTAGAWEKLNAWAQETGLAFKRADGREFFVCTIFIDSGDGNLTDVVYDFCHSWGNTFPSKGWGNIQKKKRDKDEAGDAPGGIKRYRRADIGGGTTLYEISTNYYKNRIYSHLKIQRKDGKYQAPGFCDFPRDYDQRYFEMLIAEEKRSDGSFYAGRRRNESLDCRVMCECASDAFLDSKVLEAKGRAQMQGMSAADIQKIDHRAVLNHMENAILPPDGR